MTTIVEGADTARPLSRPRLDDTTTRSAARSRAATVATVCILLGVVLGALLLRVVGLGWGRPYVYHPDEWAIANPAMNMVRSASWNPALFTYPSGLIYVERFIVELLHATDPTVSLVTRSTTGFGGLPWRAASNALPEQFSYFFAGRAFVALLGALLVLPTYLAARLVSNPIGALAGAIAIAVAPLAVSNSHYLTTDIPTAALTATTLCLSLYGLARGRRWLVAAGFAAGLAASTKYNGGLVVIVPLAVILTSMPPRQLLQRSTFSSASLVVLASLAGFILLTPALVFDPVHVWTGGILFQVEQYSGGHPGAEGTDNAVYFLRVLAGGGGLGLGLAVLTAIGLLISVLQHRRSDLVVLSFVFAYYMLICLPPVRFERNLVPLLPFLAVLAGRSVGWLADVLGAARRGASMRRRALAVAVGLGVIAATAAPAFAASVANDQLFRSTDTRTTALRWIDEHLPNGAAIAREEFTPQVPVSAYRVGFEWLLADKPLDWYRSAGFDYLIVSSFQMNRYLGREPQDAFYRSVLAQPIVLDVRPSRGQQGPRVIVVDIRGGT